MLAGSRWPYDAVRVQHSRRCGVSTSRRQLQPWAAAAQGGVALRVQISGWSRLLAVFGAKTRFVSPFCLAQIYFRYRPHSTPCPKCVCMVVFPRQPYHAVNEQNCRRCGVTTAGRLRPHHGSRSLEGETRFVYVSEGGAALSPRLAQKKPWGIIFTARLT